MELDKNSEECFNILSSLIEKDYKENYALQPSDPPDLIAKKTESKLKEIQKNLEAHTKSCTRGFRVLAELWSKKHEE